MALTWTDVLDISILLEETYPTVDILGVRYTDLKAWILALPDFAGDPNRCNEKTLEAIQMSWRHER